MSEKILIIEDEPLVRRELEAFLEENGFQAEAPEPGGLSAQEVLDGAPDLILLERSRERREQRPSRALWFSEPLYISCFR